MRACHIVSTAYVNTYATAFEILYQGQIMLNGDILIAYLVTRLKTRVMTSLFSVVNLQFFELVDFAFLFTNLLCKR